MAKSFSLSVVSHDGALFEGTVTSVVATAVTGELGIMANHTPLMAALKAGHVHIFTEDGDEEVLYVSSGFMEVQPDKTIILADAGEHAENLDEEQVRLAKEKAEKAMEGKTGDGEAHLELQRLAAQLSAIRKRRR